jgi:TolB protein
MSMHALRRIAPASVLLLLLGASLLTTASPPAEAAFPGRNGRIFFERRPTELADRELFSMRPDGSGKRRLTNNDLEEQDLAVSADGRRLVFERELNGTEDEVFKMRTNGTRVRRLTNNSGISDSDPSWSPRGNKIVFARDRANPGSGNFALYKMDPDGDNVTPITPLDTNRDLDPRWSPDGDWIAFDREDNLGDSYICLVRPNGNGDHCITPLTFDNTDAPDWSPNSKLIAFEASEDANSWDQDNVFIVRRSGNGLVRLTSRNDAPGDPAFSPNGRFVLFENNGDYPSRIFRIALKDFAIDPITPPGYDAEDQDWAPRP